ncbi:MAG: hypothetical protein DHS20C19_26490 [Acidimicrobiales bacterium]|nr:MAG: hypothetical protein DHS20C19_26490 [Acidimicrobiales bacterium]
MPSAVEPVLADPPSYERRSVLRQHWSELAFFHWAYAPEIVQPLLPVGLTVDTFDGTAWVGLIPFEMRNVRVGRTPPVPWLGTFVEINVRTYVVDPSGRRAVWFFSLDVPRSAVVAIARTVFALPYYRARATHIRDEEHHRYEMRRGWPHRRRPSAEMRFRVGDAIPDATVGDLDCFLTARWALMTQRRGRLLYGQVHHPRWPLYRVEDVHIEESVIEAAGLPSPTGGPRALYSPGVDVEAAWLQTVPSEKQ